MKATVVQLWALLCLVFQVSLELLDEMALGAAEFFTECGIEMNCKNVALGLLYTICAYLFVISVWLVLM